MKTNVYIDPKYPGKIIKEYQAEKKSQQSLAELSFFREKIIVEEKCQDWPYFLIQPKKVSEVKDYKFKTILEYIEGENLYNYIKNNGLNIITCAYLLSSIEQDVMAAERFVIPDIANYGNVIISRQNGILTYKIIDSDDIVFDDYYCTAASNMISGEIITKGEYAHGIKKCFNDNTNMYLYPNKQLDIRSMYALLYMMLNCYGSFYPMYSNGDKQNCIYFLNELNIPQGSELYKKLLITLSEEEPNQWIGDSLYELIDDGYELSESRLDDNRIYKLKKKRKSIFYS